MQIGRGVCSVLQTSYMYQIDYLNINEIVRLLLSTVINIPDILAASHLGIQPCQLTLDKWHAWFPSRIYLKYLVVSTGPGENLDIDDEF